VERWYRKLSTLALKCTGNELYERCCFIGGCNVASNRVQQCIDTDLDGACQRYSVCLGLSPGPVVDSETLARWVYSPPHVKRPLPGELSDVFFEDAFDNGLSVQRVLCRWNVSRDEIHRRGQQTVANDGTPNADGDIRVKRTYLGAVQFSAKELRALRAEAEQSIAELHIYDTALSDNPRHAEVMANIRGSTKKQKKMVRQQMRVHLYILANSNGIYKSPLLCDDNADLLALNMPIKDMGYWVGI
jgi:hypothetical protein